MAGRRARFHDASSINCKESEGHDAGKRRLSSDEAEIFDMLQNEFDVLFSGNAPAQMPLAVENTLDIQSAGINKIEH